MTLQERVKRAGNTVKEQNNDLTFEELRKEVGLILSAQAIAEIVKSNPQRARNEVKSACRQVFADPRWSSVPNKRRIVLTDQMLDAIFGFGVLEDLLADPRVTEVMVNGVEHIFYERDGQLYPSDKQFANEEDLRALIDRILGPLGRRVDESSPMVNARLPLGHRVHVVLPPVSLCGPILTIRKFSEHVITLEEMVASESIEPTVKTFLEWAVLARKSIAVSGGTGSGKTTLLNSLSCVIPHSERIITIEDSAELRFLTHPHVVGLEARPENAEGLGAIDIRDLVVNALRMRPDRIIVGECRGGEALDMLQALNTGHAGSLTTLHANSPADSISRLTTMVRFAADLPVDVIEANIASALDLVVQTQRSLSGQRSVTEIVTLAFDSDKRRCIPTPIYTKHIGMNKGVWSFVPAWIDDLVSQGVSSTQEVEAWKSTCCFS